MVMKMKEKLGQRILKNSILFFLYIYSVELIVRLNAHNAILNPASIRILISSISISLFLSLIVSLFSNKISKILMSLFTFLIMLYSWIEINLYTYMGFFMGIGNADQGTKITEYIKDYMEAAKIMSYLVIIPFILLMIYLWWIRTKLQKLKLERTIFFKFTKERKLNNVITIIVTILLISLVNFLYYETLKINWMQNSLQSVKNTDLILSSDNSNLSVSQFGLLVYGGSDVFIQTFKIEKPTTVYVKEDKELKTQTDLSRTIDDTAWNKVIANETNETYNSLNNYFINRDISDKNEYTGIFKGKNLIVILMESTNDIAINEEEFPTLYKIYNEGISFTNNYSPRNNCSTGNNEMTVMTSLFTINNTCTANTYKKKTYFESIFNLFNNAGYQTSSYHDYAEYYYDRKTIHPNMGSMHYYNVVDLGIPWTSEYKEWPSDVDLVTTATPYFINEDHFMSFMISVTTHQPYSVSSQYGDAHLDELSKYDYSTSVKRYMSKMKELDSALGLLITKLTEAGKLDDTVIALFGDHYPYGLSSSDINSVLDYDVTVNKETDRTPMIIYNSKIKGAEVDKYTTIIDLLPTLLNMFDLNYDPRLYLGHDVFSDYSDRAVFADGSWQDSLGFYSATSGTFIPKDQTNTYTNEELININNEITLRQQMSALAIKNNYFSYLNNALMSYNTIETTQKTTTQTNEMEG